MEIWNSLHGPSRASIHENGWNPSQAGHKRESRAFFFTSIWFKITFFGQWADIGQINHGDLSRASTRKNIRRRSQIATLHNDSDDSGEREEEKPDCISQQNWNALSLTHAHRDTCNAIHGLGPYLSDVYIRGDGLPIAERLRGFSTLNSSNQRRGESKILLT